MRCIVKERAALAACFAAVIRCDGLNYSRKNPDNARIICNTLAECRVMLCKLLILKDKLRITLEWIHSRAAASRKNPALGNQSRYNAGNQQQQSRNQQREPQGLTSRTECATLRSIETTRQGNQHETSRAAQGARESAARRTGCARMQTG